MNSGKIILFVLGLATTCCQSILTHQRKSPTQDPDSTATTDNIFAFINKDLLPAIDGARRSAVVLGSLSADDATKRASIADFFYDIERTLKSGAIPKLITDSNTKNVKKDQYDRFDIPISIGKKSETLVILMSKDRSPAKQIIDSLGILSDIGNGENSIDIIANRVKSQRDGEDMLFVNFDTINLNQMVSKFYSYDRKNLLDPDLNIEFNQTKKGQQLLIWSYEFKKLTNGVEWREFTMRKTTEKPDGANFSFVLKCTPGSVQEVSLDLPNFNDIKVFQNNLVDSLKKGLNHQCS